MFRLGSMPPQVDADLITQLGGVDPATIGHWHDTGFAHELVRIVPGGVVAGTALTVRLGDVDATALHYALDLIRPGDVLVVSMGGDRTRACLGFLAAEAARVRGAVGVVIDGMATDSRDLLEVALPVWALGLSARTTRPLGLEGDINLPVSIAGCVVSPGDVVLANDDGVCFLTPERAAELLPRALAAQNSEIGERERILAGVSPSTITGARELFEAGLRPSDRPHLPTPPGQS